MSRQEMSQAEREVRSRLSRLFFETPLLRGSLGVRKITCGDPQCRCTRGQTHDTLYLSYLSVLAAAAHQLGRDDRSLTCHLDSWKDQCIDEQRIREEEHDDEHTRIVFNSLHDLRDASFQTRGYHTQGQQGETRPGTSGVRPGPCLKHPQ